jgi:hypothetical protein
MEMLVAKGMIIIGVYGWSRILTGRAIVAERRLVQSAGKNSP